MAMRILRAFITVLVVAAIAGGVYLANRYGQ
jgi:hypothetical protein